MTDTQDDGAAAAMKDQLQKDVASWSAARTGETIAVAKPPAPARAPRAKAKAPVAPVLIPVVKKPFKMSYDGTTDRDYIAHRINLGAR